MKTLWQQIFQYTLGAIIIIGFFVLLVTLINTKIPTENEDVLNLVVGALIGSFATIVGYFFGSSKGSSDKNDLLNKK
jgi:uncharacterized membrane protein